MNIYLLFVSDLINSDLDSFSNKWDSSELSYYEFTDDSKQEFELAIYNNLILGNCIETKKIIVEDDIKTAVEMVTEGFLRGKGLI